jgi:hypothetical protein
MNFENIVAALISAIIGDIVGTIIKSSLDKNREIELSHNQIIKENYKNLLIFMACVLDINKKRYFAMNEQIPNKTSHDYLNQLKEYYYHSILDSSDLVLIELKKFIIEPSKINYVNVAKSMRKELWAKKTKLGYDELILEN